MSARESAGVGRAIRLVLRGISPARAAEREGVNKSSVYRAMRRYGIQCSGTPGRKPRRR
jgi:transposase